jgi:hypothetical protein
MQTRRTAALMLLLALTSLSALAQTPTTRLAPTDALSVTWPAATVSADGLDAPDGYRIKALAVSGGSVLKSWEAAATLRTLVISDYPTVGAFTLTVHPFNVAGEAGSSNGTGPFGRAKIPAAVTGVAASVVPVP